MRKLTTTRRRPQARGRATRQRLLRGAEVLFTRGGYDGTTMSDVARQAGVGVGTLYHHFPDKRTLLLDLVDDWGGRVAAERRTEENLETLLGDDPRATIQRGLRDSYQRLKKQPPLYLLVLGLAERDPEIRVRYQRIEQIAIERLAALIEFGQRRGLLRADIDAASAAFLIHNAIDMAVIQLLVRDGSGADPDRVLVELADMICRYALVESG